MPADLVSQIGPIEELAQALGLPVIERPGTEADDVMATLAERGARAGIEVVLVTADKDMLQVVGERVRVMVPQAREEYAWLDADGVRAKWGVGPEHIRDVLALMGDSSDNIPGVPGVGEKTAVELMKQFGSLEGVYARLDEVAKPALRAKLETHRELAFLSRELATVRPDLDLPYSWDDLRRAPIRRDALREFARRHQIARLERIAETEGRRRGARSSGAAPRPRCRPPASGSRPRRAGPRCSTRRRRAPPRRRSWPRRPPFPRAPGSRPRSTCGPRRGRRRPPPPTQRRCSRAGSRGSTRCARAPSTASPCCRSRAATSRGARPWWASPWRRATAPPATCRSPTRAGPTSIAAGCATGSRRCSPTAAFPRLARI